MSLKESGMYEVAKTILSWHGFHAALTPHRDCVLSEEAWEMACWWRREVVSAAWTAPATFTL